VCRSDRIGPYAQNCNFILTLSLLRNFDGLFCAFDCFKSEFIVQMRKILCFLLTFAVSVRESSLVPFDIFPRLDRMASLEMDPLQVISSAEMYT